VTAKPDGRPLRGWAVLLLWLPAACDLTGTTVRPYTLTVRTFPFADLALVCFILHLHSIPAPADLPKTAI
jgi:hypothetical protein